MPKGFVEFDNAGRMKPSSLYLRIIDAREELMKFTCLTWGSSYITDRYSEHVESAGAVSHHINQSTH